MNNRQREEGKGNLLDPYRDR